MQPLEAPAVQLARERLVLALGEVPRHHLLHEPVFVVDFPATAVRLCGNWNCVSIECQHNTERTNNDDRTLTIQEMICSKKDRYYCEGGTGHEIQIQNRRLQQLNN